MRMSPSICCCSRRWSSRLEEEPGSGQLLYSALDKFLSLARAVFHLERKLANTCPNLPLVCGWAKPLNPERWLAISWKHISMALVRCAGDPLHVLNQCQVLSLEPVLMLCRAARMADALAAGQTVTSPQPCVQSTVGTEKLMDSCPLGTVLK